ncbi:hypothetical protein [Parafrankia sp. FMc2]|uniref:hypothetical protein n=1 Tax=Parafrankia sp. FMc2 TaxID=3233196 RepID=UPI0034D7B11A
MGKILRHGTITIDDFSTEGLADPEASALGRRVEWSLDPSLRRGMNDFGVGIVEVEHEDGRVARGETLYPLGHPEKPLSWDDVVAKLRRCMDAAAGDLGPAADRVVDIVQGLDTTTDVRVLLDAVRS